MVAVRFGNSPIVRSCSGMTVTPGIVDAHAHINGAEAAGVYTEVCDLYGVTRVYSQTQLTQAEAVRGVMGDRIRFVAIPEYMAEDKARAFREGFVFVKNVPYP